MIIGEIVIALRPENKHLIKLGIFISPSVVNLPYQVTNCGLFTIEALSERLHENRNLGFKMIKDRKDD
jgi:hypothetical protein